VTSHRPPILVGLAIVATMLAGCSGGTASGNPTTPPGSPPASTTASSTAASDGAPPVQNPLPAKVLDGSPCDTALTNADVKEFIGNSDPAKHDEDPTGQICFWYNAAGSGARIGVTYQTEIDGGLRLAYKNVKPTAVRWDVLQPIQGYPAVSYLPAGDDPNAKSQCHIVVAVADNLSYSVGMVVSNNAQQRGIDGCTAGRDVADRVMTNLKARA
jgi:hypothetical protein